MTYSWHDWMFRIILYQYHADQGIYIILLCVCYLCKCHFFFFYSYFFVELLNFCNFCFFNIIYCRLDYMIDIDLSSYSICIIFIALTALCQSEKRSSLVSKGNLRFLLCVLMLCVPQES